MKLKEVRRSIKKTLNKIWFLLWKDESWKGWLFSVIFIAVFVKFIFFPVLSLATGTSLPLAIVESCSMYHEGNIFSNFGEWWQRHERKYTNFDMNKGQFYDFKFKNGFNKGDILFIIGAKPEKIKIGDVVIFNAGMQNPLIHRVIEIKQDQSIYLFSTIGDNNNGQLEIERDISENQIVGKAVFKLAPYLGWGKLIFYEQFKTESERGFCKER